MNEQTFIIPEDYEIKIPEMPTVNSLWPLMLLLFTFSTPFGEIAQNSFDSTRLTRAMLERDPIKKTKLTQECFQEYEKQFRASMENLLSDIKECLKNTNFFEGVSDEIKDALMKAIDEDNQDDIKKYLDKLTEEMKGNGYDNENENKN